MPTHRLRPRRSGLTRRARPALERLEARLVLTALTVGDLAAPDLDGGSVGDPLVQSTSTGIIHTSDASPLLTVAPPATGPTVSGMVYLDLNGVANEFQTGPGLPGRVVFLDLDGSGIEKVGDPTATTDATGHYAFASYTGPTAPVLEAVEQDVSDRYRVTQTVMALNSSGFHDTNLGVVPYSPIAPVPVVLNPLYGGYLGGTLTNYVDGLYEAVLGRRGSGDEVAAWTTAITSQGLSSDQVAAAFFNSFEHRTEEVAGYYRDFLHRDVDQLGRSWVNDLQDGESEQAVVKEILDSPEYQTAHADNTHYVRDLYLDVLGRVGGDSEVAGYVKALGAGTLSRRAVVAAFVNSLEADEQLVTSFYVNNLRRQPEAGGTSDGWVAMLVGGVSAGKVDAGILDSPEFRQEVGTEVAPVGLPSPIPVTPVPVPVPVSMNG